MSNVKVKRGERVKWLKELFSSKKAVPPPADALPTNRGMEGSAYEARTTA